MDSLKWEKILRPKLEQVLRVKGLETIDWSSHPELQKNGIDAILHNEKSDIELKTRSYWTKKFHDILLETETYGKSGWFYSTKADLVTYVWVNATETNLENPGYFILMGNKLRDWFEENKSKFETKTSGSIREETSATWVTKNKAVPIDSFPPGTLARFRPKLTPQEQTRLSDFLNINTFRLSSSPFGRGRPADKVKKRLEEVFEWK